MLKAAAVAPRQDPRARVLANMQADPISGCWNWTLRADRAGYGRVKVTGFGRAGNFVDRAHRYAWAAFNGPVPDGMHVLHRCDNRRCCNPGHLFLGTHDDNMADMIAKGRGRYGPHAPHRNAGC